MRDVNLVFVGNGTAEQAAAFRERFAQGQAVYTDPDRAAYVALEMKRGVAATLHPKAILNATRAFTRGFRQTKVAGDPWQLGGVLAVMTDGRVVFRRNAKVSGEQVPPQAVLADLDLFLQST